LSEAARRRPSGTSIARPAGKVQARHRRAWIRARKPPAASKPLTARASYWFIAG